MKILADERLAKYLAYHRESARIGDIDPSYKMLLYVCDRYELSQEQRYWLSWLYSMFYCGASAFYVYNEFPDYETVDVARMQRWWDDRGRANVIAQTDRRWVRSSSMFVPAFESYRRWMRGETQHDHFMNLTRIWKTPEDRYEAVYESATQLYSYGQFALFLYLEALHTVTPVDLCPTNLDLEKAWSCRFGLYYAYGMDHLIQDTACSIPHDAVDATSARWSELRETLSKLEEPPTVWQTETMLCAFRKFYRGKRYVGYYLDRQALEIAKMEMNVRDGVDWSVLWQYRAETYASEHRAELTGIDEKCKLTREWKRETNLRTQRLIEEAAP